MLMHSVAPLKSSSASSHAWKSVPPSVLGAEGAGPMEMVGVPMTYQRNVEIYGEGEPADHVYKVVTGAARSYKILNDGRRQIGAFYLPGDVFGLEAGEIHHCSAEAVANSTIMVMRRSTLVRMAERDGDIARQLWTVTAKELERVQNHMVLLIRSAQERVASFLLEMAERLSGTDVIDLPMPRQDIADYLGLTIETISRTLSHLEAASAIAVPTCRRIVLRDRIALRRLNG